MKTLVHKNEKLILQCGFNKDVEENLYILDIDGKIVITDGRKTDYPISYGLNSKGEFLETGYDGTFFYEPIWLQHQDTILETIKKYHLNKTKGEQNE